MTLTVEGRHLAGGPARGLVPGAQEVQRHQARAARRRHRPDLQRRIRRRVRPALRRQGRRRQPRRAVRRGRGHQAAPAQGADGQEGRHLSASRPSRSTSSSRTSGWPRSASRRWRSPKACKSQNSVLASGQIDTRGDRVLVRVSGQFASVDDIRNVPIAAGGRTDQARRLHDRHARLRGSADLHRAPQRPAGADARHHDDQRRQHRRARQGDRRRRSPRSRPSCRTASSSSAWPTSPPSSSEVDLGIRALADGGARHRARGQPGQPRLAHRHRGRRLSVPLVLGVVALVMLAMGWNLERISLGSLIIALGLLVDDAHHRGRDDGGEDGGRLGPR